MIKREERKRQWFKFSPTRIIYIYIYNQRERESERESRERTEEK